MCREMTNEDIGFIAQLEKKLFSLPWKEEDYRRELEENEFAHYYVMENDGVIVAYGGIWTLYDQAQITTIGVDKSFQNQGLGQILMKKLEEKAIQMQCELCTLEVRKSNFAAQRLYEKMGYQQVAIRKSYYSDNYEDALLMMKSLGGTDGKDNFSD